MGQSAELLDPAFLHARDAFEAVEASLGELAAYVSDIADNLSHDPERVAAALEAEWPDAEAMRRLAVDWIKRRDALVTAWRNLKPSARALHPLPPFGAHDPSRPVV